VSTESGQDPGDASRLRLSAARGRSTQSLKRMETVEEARDVIFQELMSTDSEVRREYLRYFGEDAKQLAETMAIAYTQWRALNAKCVGEERAIVSALVYAAITLHILSTKLFLSGNTVAAGNLSRQVIESISLALLCSSAQLDVLDRFIADKYSSNDAVRDALRHSEKLSLKDEAKTALKQSQEFYHKYSHITKMTIASGMSFSRQGELYLGASFDAGKLDAYTKEMKGRVSLASVFENFVRGVDQNISKW
jgi:hypothetical protein